MCSERVRGKDIKTFLTISQLCITNLVSSSNANKFYAERWQNAIHRDDNTWRRKTPSADNVIKELHWIRVWVNQLSLLSHTQLWR